MLVILLSLRNLLCVRRKAIIKERTLCRFEACRIGLRKVSLPLSSLQRQCSGHSWWQCRHSDGEEGETQISELELHLPDLCLPVVETWGNFDNKNWALRKADNLCCVLDIEKLVASCGSVALSVSLWSLSGRRMHDSRSGALRRQPALGEQTSTAYFGKTRLAPDWLHVGNIDNLSFFCSQFMSLQLFSNPFKCFLVCSFTCLGAFSRPIF